MKTMKKVFAMLLALAMIVTAVPVANASAATYNMKAGSAGIITKSLYAGKTHTLKLNGYKASQIKSTKWSVGKTSVVKLASKTKTTAKMTCVGKGYTVVTAKMTLTNKKVKTFKAKITVKNPSVSVAAAEVEVGKTAQLAVVAKPDNATVAYASDNTEIATVTDQGVVTGVKAGTANVTVTLTCGTKKVTAVAVVTVKAAEEVAPVVALTAITQTASNAFRVEFGADASKTYTKDDISVKAADDSIELKASAMVFSEDGKSADVTLFGNLTNAVLYKVTCKDTSIDLTAKVGEVTRVAILTASAEENVKTPIEFKLFDADGIDVTPSINLNTTCFVNVDGDYTAAELSKASKATITMNAVGSAVTVTITYNSNAVGAQDVTATQEIKCVSAKASKGQLLYYQIPRYLSGRQQNADDLCAKFYLGLSSSSISLEKMATDELIFLCAKDAKGEVISYDSYEAEVADESVAAVSVAVDSGKFAQLTVTGNEVGKTQINITATKNGAETYYTIPVNVSTKYEAVSMEFVSDTTTLSNVDEPDYGATVRAALKDRNGQYLDAGHYTVLFEVDGKDSNGAVMVGSTRGDNNGAGTGAWNGYSAKVVAWGANGGSYTIKATATDSDTGISFVKRVVIAVKELKASNGYALTYQIETKNNNGDPEARAKTNTIDLNPDNGDDDALNVRMYATCNGLFAGYVRGNGTDNDVTIANPANPITPTTETAITNVNFTVKYGTKRFTGDLVNAVTVTTQQAIAVPTTGTVLLNGVNGIAVYTDDAGNPVVDGDGNPVLQRTIINYDVATKKSSQLASLGGYTIEYSYYKGGVTTKTVSTTKTITVKNTVVLPTYTITTKSVESLDVNDVIAVFKTNVNMNNNDSDHEAIGIVDDSSAPTPVNYKIDGNKVVVKAFTITEVERGGVNWGAGNGIVRPYVTWVYTFTINSTFKAD